LKETVQVSHIGGERRRRGRDIPVPDWESEKVATLHETFIHSFNYFISVVRFI